MNSDFSPYITSYSIPAVRTAEMFVTAETRPPSKAIRLRYRSVDVEIQSGEPYGIKPPLAVSYFCGSVQRLGNGNTVVGWGGQTAYGAPGTAAYTEVAPDGVKWLEFAMYPVELSYRVFRFTRSDQGEWTGCLKVLGKNFPMQ